MTGKRDALSVTWTEEAIRALGVKTDVVTAASIFGISQTRVYDRIKSGTFPVPVVTIAGHIVVPVAPILRLLEIGTDATRENATPSVDPEELADMVAERVVSRLAAAMVGASRPQAAEVPPRPLKSVTGSGPEAA